MHREMLLGKIHRAKVTHCELHYEGSCAIDLDLMEASGIIEFQRIDIYVIDNGERFTTYAIKGERGSGMISLNGAAARRAQKGDLVIIAAYGSLSDEEVQDFKPKLVFVDENNRKQEERGFIPTQMM
ncbi:MULTISPECIES: aspartate 1-decarboxylase [Limnobacter]|uniref:Aspartate 1-decarboxylase n=1 Tax=Limnobacter litoralis TaxID=481366 RepID=A0ABQ5YRS0_9BURK|nr:MULTISPECIES: aspartate 1-decarboxylase [Limnobacter]GLR27188.1 aspartate 1-decarboxylase [Limnobacter litoralis]HEX5485045.1 aspartate 1-decarboxylase [Limnobacter sp.]